MDCKQRPKSVQEVIVPYILRDYLLGSSPSSSRHFSQGVNGTGIEEALIWQSVERVIRCIWGRKLQLTSRPSGRDSN